MTTSPQINPNASYFAMQGYGNNPFNKDNVKTTPRVPQEGVSGVGPKGPAAPAQRSEAYEGQAVVSEIASEKAFQAREYGMGGTNHPVDANVRECQWWRA